MTTPKHARQTTNMHESSHDTGVNHTLRDVQGCRQHKDGPVQALHLQSMGSTQVTHDAMPMGSVMARGYERCSWLHTHQHGVLLL